MTRLFIDGNEVALDQDFNIEYITENPYFTRKGEYTYDIDIDLRYPQNRQVYKNINRMDITSTLSNRTAELIVDGVVVIRGIEIVLSTTFRSVSIQIVSGNSQLNYDGNRKIRDFDIPVVNYNAESAVQTLLGTYKSYNAVYTPVVYQENNRYQTYNKVSNNGDIIMIDESTLIPQYYLFYIIDYILQSMGFKKGTVNLTYLNLWYRLIIVNSNKKLKPAELLPDWTVSEMLEEIELFFNCILTVDKFTGVYNITDIGTYFDNAIIYNIDDILDDDVEKNYNDETNYAFVYEKVSYDLDSSTYYNYLKLKDGVREACTVIDIESYDKADISKYNDYFSSPVILHDLKYDVDYVINNFKVGNQEDVKGLTVIDRFIDDGEDNNQNETVFKIIPAEVDYIDVWDEKTGKRVVVPAVKQISSVEDDTGEVGVNDLINGDGLFEQDIPDRIKVGIYYGLGKGYYESTGASATNPNTQVPMSAVDNMALSYPSIINGTQGLINMPLNYTLALAGDDGLYNKVYKNKREIDTSVEYIFRFVVTERLYDLKNLFCIRNKLYYCKQIKYTISPKGYDKIAEGIFYLAE